MQTALWIGYDTLVFVVGYWLLERELTARGKRVVALVVLAGLSVAGYGWYSDHRESIENASLRQKVAGTQTECESIRRNEMNLQATVVAVATKINANPTPEEIKAAAAQLFSVTRSATITAHASMTGEAVIRDKSGKIIQRSIAK
jgi:hypothetical protein